MIDVCPVNLFWRAPFYSVSLSLTWATPNQVVVALSQAWDPKTLDVGDVARDPGVSPRSRRNVDPHREDRAPYLFNTSKPSNAPCVWLEQCHEELVQVLFFEPISSDTVGSRIVEFGAAERRDFQGLEG